MKVSDSWNTLVTFTSLLLRSLQMLQNWVSSSKMATFLAVNLVKYLCTCGKRQPMCRLYLCRHCLKLRCGECVQHEVDTPYCPNCLENMPSAEAKMRKNRCSSCFDCPSCGHTLMTRATSLMVANPEDANKSTPKKMYYMACGFCRWTTRDVGLTDQLSSSGGWQDQENEDSKRIGTLLDYLRQIAQKEKAEKERKKYVKRRSHIYYSDKYGLTSVAAKRKSIAAMSNMSIKEGEELPPPVEPGKTVTEFDPLPEEFFTQGVDLSKVPSMKQRLATPEFQPRDATKLYPQHKHLLIRKSLRCKECEHNLSKPDFNPLSIKFKIQLIALNHVPEIRIFAPAVFLPQKETLVTLTLSNPSVYNTTVHFLSLDDEVNGEEEEVNAKCELPKGELVIARRDDAAMYDDQSQLQQEFRDDPSVIAFRKSNKIGVFMRVKPSLKEGDVKVRFRMQHEYRNTTAALQSEDKEPQIVWLEHTVYMAVGKIQQGYKTPP